MHNIERRLEITGMSIEELAEKSQLPADRVEAIGTGRWLPSPQERAKIAAALKRGVDEIDWGHTMPPRNVRFHRFGIQKDPPSNL